MNFRLTSLGYKLLFVPDVIVNHHRRSSPKLLWRQMYRFAIGRLQVGKKNIRMIKLSHVIAGLFLPILFFVEVLLYATGGQALLFINLFLALAIVIFGWLYSKSIKVGVNLLLVMIIASVSWSFGFLREAMLPLKDVVGK